jgi:hypothetical protein
MPDMHGAQAGEDGDDSERQPRPGTARQDAADGGSQGRAQVVGGVEPRPASACRARAGPSSAAPSPKAAVAAPETA